jgi:hypothetical protein
MSSSTSLLDLIAQSQASKEITANALFDAGSPAALFGRRASVCSGLTWGYYGGSWLMDGSGYAIANGSIALSASATNYIEADRSGAVSKNTTAFTPGRTPLYAVVTGPSTVTSYTDWRSWVQPMDIVSKGSVAVTTADVTLNESQARCRYLITTGALTGNRAVIVPAYWEGIVYCNNSGAFTTTFKTSGGSGVVVAQGKRAILLADGTNVVRVTADA